MLKERKAHFRLTCVAQKRRCNEVDAWVEHFILTTPSLELVSLLIGMREQDPDKPKKNQPRQLTLLSQDCVHQLTEHAELVLRKSPSTKPAGKNQSALNQVFKNGCDLKCNLLNRAQYNTYSLYLRPCPH